MIENQIEGNQKEEGKSKGMQEPQNTSPQEHQQQAIFDKQVERYQQWRHKHIGTSRFKCFSCGRIGNYTNRGFSPLDRRGHTWAFVNELLFEHQRPAPSSRINRMQIDYDPNALEEEDSLEFAFCDECFYEYAQWQLMEDKYFAGMLPGHKQKRHAGYRVDISDHCQVYYWPWDTQWIEE